VVATGGKSIPKMGATDFGYRLAELFGLRLTETRRRWCRLTFDADLLERLSPLAGCGGASARRLRQDGVRRSLAVHPSRP